MGKTGSRNRNKLDILKKSLQDKILIYEDSVKSENLNRVSTIFSQLRSKPRSLVIKDWQYSINVNKKQKKKV